MKHQRVFTCRYFVAKIVNFLITIFSPQVVKEGDDATFTAVVSGVPTPEIAWLKDKKMIGPSDRIKMTYNPDTHTCSMTIQKSTQEDIGVYSCRASNPAGKATCTANVVVVRK